MERLQEGQKEFLAWAKNRNPDVTKALLADFKANRSKFPSPQNNMDWWIKNKRPVDLRFYISNFVSKTAKKKKDRVDGAKKIYSDDNWEVIQILTYNAAKQYGKGSKWCICGEYPGHEDRGEYYFNNYLQNNYTGYFLFINKHPKDQTKDWKYMVCPRKDDPSNADIWDQTDNTLYYIPNGPYVKGLPSVSQFKVIDGVLVSAKYSYESEITIPDTVKAIRANALANFSGREIIISNSVEKIGAAAFLNSDIREMTIPDSVREIGRGAFAGCSNLSEVYWGSNLPDIPELTFAYCGNDLDVFIKNKINSIAPDAFKKTSGVIFCKHDNEVLVNFCNDSSNNMDLGSTEPMVPDEE